MAAGDGSEIFVKVSARAVASTSSSPVARMATFGFGKTGSERKPQEAASPICSGPSRHPGSSKISPRRASLPSGTTFSPELRVLPGIGRTNRDSRASPLAAPPDSLASSCTCSTINTASAPGGIGAPVMISTTSPEAIWGFPAGHASPARTWPITRKTVSEFTSFARTAKPSRVTRGNGGWSRSAIRATANRRPRASIRSQFAASLIRLA